MTSTEPVSSADLADIWSRHELPVDTHERVFVRHDEATGLRAIIAVHSTVLGPALGGTRFKGYDSASSALTDVLRLSEGMTFKAAAAGLPLGGGKAVIVGDPGAVKTANLLKAYGRFIDGLDGVYVTAADVGTDSDDLDVIGKQTRHVVGRSVGAGGSGDSGGSTALGVHAAMWAAAELVWGADGLHGRTVGVEGIGKVGRQLVGLLVDQGVRVFVTDPDEAAVRRLVGRHAPLVTAVPSVLDADVDVYAPCALGATLDRTAVLRLRARLVCGAANNQLSHAEVDSALWARDVLWVPDYVANAGGLIQVGGEVLGLAGPEVRRRVLGIADTARHILADALSNDVPTGQVAASYATRKVELGRSST